MVTTKQDAWTTVRDQEYFFQQISYQSNLTSGLYEPNQNVTREMHVIDGSHFSYFIGRNMTYLNEVFGFIEESN